MFSKKKDTREVLSGESLELTSQDLYDIGDFDDFDGFDSPGSLPNLEDEFNDGLLSSCGDEPIILSTTNCRDQHDAALLPFVNMDTYIHMSSPRPIGKIVQLESSEQKPLEPLGRGCWDSMELEQPGTLEELGMDPENEGIISDFLGFVRKKESCKKVCKAWTRFYMLYEPPGTHRSSLIAAMANYLKFGVYDLDLTSLSSIGELLDMLFSTPNCSLIAIRDFDHCATKLPILENELTVSLLSEYVDDLLSTCGGERIIVFTTTHRNRHDAALLLPVNVDIYVQNTSPQPEFYKRIGKSWKKGYLLYDSPCTDRSSLIVAMANCLEFDIYDLDLTGVSSISELTNVLVSVRNRSVIAIKDFDRWFAMLPNLKNELTISVGRPPDQHGEGNTSTARETPSHNVQNGMEGELVGQNQEANVLRRDFMGGLIALNTESGLITVGRLPDQHGEKNTSTACEEPSNNVETRMEIEPVGQNQEANVFQRDFTEGLIALSTENGLIIGIVKTPPFHDSYPGNYPIDYKESENAGSSFERASQVNDQSTWSTPYPNQDALVLHQPQITSMLSENRGGSIDWRNSLASQAEPFSDTHISGSSNLAFPTWSDQAAPSQYAEGQSVQSTVYPDHNAVHRFPEGHVFESINWNEHTNSLASQAEPFSDRLISRSIWRPPDQLEGQTMQFTAHPNPNALGLPQFQIASSQVPSANEGRIASQVEAFFMGHVSESSNLAFPEYSDAAAPSQPVATILTERQDTRSVKVKATYGDSIIKFQLPLTSGIKELMQEVSKTLDCELGSFNVDYKDEDGDWILMVRDDNVSEYLQLLTSLGNQASKLKVRDKVPNTTNICETCGSLKQQRP
ncbi:hypothetical protein RHGRI_038690 [Rhododendron griersonianum]|uniref:PB1 domain-containing protein n=1 Tax=Rhododendron griersonianum TaxID=479676 RepID=A0AAV6HMI6_9ERIC|nr:hypothetical protein RHGRI_038690 [Rhododendron griersonianum]